MKGKITALAGVLSLALLAPMAAHAQGVVNGASEGIDQGNKKAGPVGAVVGGAVGAVTGGVNGLLGINERPRFHRYVIEQHRPSYQYREHVVVGAVLPEEGVEYYDVPPDYGETQYRYTIVNDEVVLVDPQTRRIVEVVQ